MNRFALVLLSGFGVAFLGVGETWAESPRDTIVEIKFGPWRPSIDSEFPEGVNPYKEVMGSGQVLMSKLEIEFELYNEFGVFAIAGSAGFARDKGKALTKKGEKAEDTTTFNVVPLSFSFVYRFDYLAQRYWIPLVPVIKAGFDYYVWWFTNGVGKVPRTDDGSIGQGGTFGGHVAVGLSFLLDFLARDMAKTFDADFGVNNTYLFGEYVFSFVNDFGSNKSLDLSARYFMFGIAFEF